VRLKRGESTLCKAFASDPIRVAVNEEAGGFLTENGGNMRGRRGLGRFALEGGNGGRYGLLVDLVPGTSRHAEIWTIENQ